MAIQNVLDSAVHLYRNGSLLPCKKSYSKASTGWGAAASLVRPEELLLAGRLEGAAPSRVQLVH